MSNRAIQRSMHCTTAAGGWRVRIGRSRSPLGHRGAEIPTYEVRPMDQWDGRSVGVSLQRLKGPLTRGAVDLVAHRFDELVRRGCAFVDIIEKLVQGPRIREDVDDMQLGSFLVRVAQVSDGAGLRTFDVREELPRQLSIRVALAFLEPVVTDEHDRLRHRPPLSIDANASVRLEGRFSHRSRRVLQGVSRGAT